MAKTKDQPKFDLDHVLEEEIGQFGKFQVIVAVHCTVAVFFMAWTVNEFIFSTARIETRCVVPECDNEPTEFAPSWLEYALPSSGDGYDNCQRYGNTSWPGDTCAADAFDTSVVQPCDDYVYEHQNTLVYDFELACQEWLRALIGSVRILGTITALPLTGFISDRWGRKIALSIAVFGGPCVGILRYWVHNYYLYIAVVYMETLVGGGGFSCSYVLLPEWLGRKYRPMGGAIINTAYTLGQVMLGIIAWSVPNWRNLVLALCIPQFICIVFFWTAQESLRWYLSKRKFKQAERLLKKAARINNKKVSDRVLDELRAHTETEMEERKEKEDRPLLIRLVWKHKTILTRCLVTPVWWFTIQLVHYGLSVNVVSLAGSMHWNFVAVAAIEIPGFWTVPLFIDRLGRKPLLIMALMTCAVSQAAFIFIPRDMYTLSLCSYLLGKLAIAVVVTTASIYTLELFPTQYRHQLYAYASMLGCFGSLLAPLTPVFAAATFQALPFVMFGGVAFVAGLLTLLVPETRGARLPDTFEEAEQIGKLVSARL